MGFLDRDNNNTVLKMFTFSTGGDSVGAWGARMARIARRRKRKYVCEEADVLQLRKINASAPREYLLAEQGTLAEDLKEGGGVR
jgi:hypothetical protein